MLKAFRIQAYFKQFLKQVPELEWQARRQMMAQSSVARPSVLASASWDVAPEVFTSEPPAHPNATAKMVAKRNVLAEKLNLISVALRVRVSATHESVDS